MEDLNGNVNDFNYFHENAEKTKPESWAMPGEYSSEIYMKLTRGKGND